jgi:hypothetical protein
MKATQLQKARDKQGPNRPEGYNLLANRSGVGGARSTGREIARRSTMAGDEIDQPPDQGIVA